MHELDEEPYVSSDEDDNQIALNEGLVRSKSAVTIKNSAQNTLAKTPSGQAPFLTSIAEGTNSFAGHVETPVRTNKSSRPVTPLT